MANFNISYIYKLKDKFSGKMDVINKKIKKNRFKPQLLQLNKICNNPGFAQLYS